VSARIARRRLETQFAAPAWAYVPAVQILMRVLVVTLPFSSGTAADKVRVLSLLSIRIVCPGEPQVIACRHLLASYHRHRVSRVLADDYGTVWAVGNRAGGFVGAVGMSFLTAV